MIFTKQISPLTSIYLNSAAKFLSSDKNKIVLPAHISRESKQHQFKISRFLLEKYAPIEIVLEKMKVDFYGKPFYEGNPFYFNISHCPSLVGVIISQTNPVALDIESCERKIPLRMISRFLNTPEINLVQQHYQEISNIETLLWCCKETIYKYYPEQKLNFLDIDIVKINFEHKIVEFQITSQIQELFFFEYQNHWVVYKA